MTPRAISISRSIVASLLLIQFVLILVSLVSILLRYASSSPLSSDRFLVENVPGYHLFSILRDRSFYKVKHIILGPRVRAVFPYSISSLDPIDFISPSSSKRFAASFLRAGVEMDDKVAIISEIGSRSESRLASCGLDSSDLVKAYRPTRNPFYFSSLSSEYMVRIVSARVFVLCVQSIASRVS